MIRFHKEGKQIILISTIVSVIVFLLLILYTRPFITYPVALVVLVLYIMILRFFRKPARKFEINENHILAPADGKVVAIEKINDDEYFQDDRIQVSIFMSVHNVHINWFPITGKISYYKYHPGKYLLARNPKSSVLNERTTTVLKSDKHEILIRQIAGYVARRIICYSQEGKTAQQGEELGFIRFGSRVDILLPVNSEISVSLGDITRGGITKIAEINI